MIVSVEIDGGFAEVGAGAWLMGHGQPVAYFGRATRHRRTGWRVSDRSKLDAVITTAAAKCADSSRPFLTHIPCASPVLTVSDKVLVAPSGARNGSYIVKVVPMSVKGALCVTEFNEEWVVMATKSRTTRICLSEGETVSVRPEAVVAWTGKMPTGFCPRLSIWDVLLPRGARELFLTFYGPGVVWVEGSTSERRRVNGV